MSFNLITDPDTLMAYSIFSEKGLSMLKNYVREFQEGGANYDEMNNEQNAAAIAEALKVAIRNAEISKNRLTDIIRSHDEAESRVAGVEAEATEAAKAARKAAEAARELGVAEEEPTEENENYFTYLFKLANELDGLAAAEAARAGTAAE